MVRSNFSFPSEMKQAFIELVYPFLEGSLVVEKEWTLASDKLRFKWIWGELNNPEFWLLSLGWK